MRVRLCNSFEIQIRSAVTVLLAVIMSCIAGCGSGTHTPTYSPAAVAITTQPASQSVPLDQTATFTVVARGTAPLAYQWSENGSIIAGATEASYTTPLVVPSDGGSKFAVTVSNSVNSVTSNTATLTVGPRSPKVGDLRFQEVGSSSEAEQSLEGYTFDIFNTQAQSIDNAVGSPLTIGGGGDCYQQTNSLISCLWNYFVTPLPMGQSGLNTYYMGGQYANFSSDLTSNPYTALDMPPPEAPDSVITSLDFQPAYNAYAIAWIQDTHQQGAFDMRREIVSPGAVQSTVAADAAASRVVTAVSFDSDGKANLLSYGWKGNTATVYDTAVISASTQQEIESGAQMLADEGYILTAFGGDPTNGFLLIGTKVQGDSLARPIIIADQSTPGCYHCSAGYAPVIWYQAPAQYYSVVYEK